MVRGAEARRLSAAAPPRVVVEATAVPTAIYRSLRLLRSLALPRSSAPPPLATAVASTTTRL